MKIDLHCHSRYSERPTIWLMKKIGCPESFTDPVDLYRIALGKGMDAVTITDHNRIEGCLNIAHLPGTFLSEELTTYFPEDGCKVHVLAYDITENEHRELQEARRNIYELVDYLRERDIVHALAHPFYAVNDRLTMEHLEKLWLLFKLVELNGDQCDAANRRSIKVIEGLTPESIARYADKHGIEPGFPEPWKKHWIGGSDDHSSLHLGRTFTRVEGASNLVEFFQGMQGGKARIEINPANPEMMGHNIYGIAYQFYKNRTGLERHVNKDAFLKFADRMLHQRPEAAAESWLERFQFMVNQRRKSVRDVRPGDSLIKLLRSQAIQALEKDPQLMRLIRKASGERPDEQKWFEFVDEVSRRMTLQLSESTLEHIVKGRVFDVFQSAGSAAALYFLLAPYFIAYAVHSKERRLSVEASRHFGTPEPGDDVPRVAHFTDTFHEVNGVGTTLKRQLESARRAGRPYRMVTCYPETFPTLPGVKNFLPLGVFDTPEYPEQKIAIPPFLEMLRWVYEQDITVIHAATPGPVGLAALAIGRILKLPVIGTYHTAFPEFARHLTQSPFVEDLMWQFMISFYAQLDLILAPSEATAAQLKNRGLMPDRIRVYPRGVDTERFHPRYRSRPRLDEPGAGDRVQLIYVGRVSKEKNMPLLAEAFRRIASRRSDVELIIVGEGPYFRAMRAELQGLPVTFTGYLAGEELLRAFASADLFIFPSTTDTFGNVVLEAQASGLPVLVTDGGGPRENLIEGETGRVLPADDLRALEEAIDDLLDEPERLVHMGDAARRYAESRGFDRAFDAKWAIYEQIHSGNRPSSTGDAPQANREAVEFAGDAEFPFGSVEAELLRVFGGGTPREPLDAMQSIDQFLTRSNSRW